MSAIAQSCSARLLTIAGVKVSTIRSVPDPLPADVEELALVAGDDAVFLHKHRDAAKALRRPDRFFAEAGVTRKRKKDINRERVATALGCELDRSSA